MSERESAKTRLEQAVARLETAIGSAAPGARTAGLEQDRTRLNEELSALRTEHQDVTRQLESLQADYSSLEQVVDQVTDRLDATIGRLRSVLET